MGKPDEARGLVGPFNLAVIPDPSIRGKKKPANSLNGRLSCREPAAGGDTRYQANYVPARQTLRHTSAALAFMTASAVSHCWGL